MQQKWAKTIRGKFRYLERPGEGPVLLFLHGLGDCADQFEPIAAHLPDTWRLLAMDQRGHGGSFKPAKDYSPLDFAADTKAFLDELDLWSVHLFGHSMGGRNALVLAAQHPERVRSLILGDIGPEENFQDIKDTRSFFERLPKSFADDGKAREHWRKRKPGYSEEQIALLMRNLERAPNGSLRWRYSAAGCIAAVMAARSRDWWEFVRGVRSPVLLLHVVNSDELPDEVARRMCRQMPSVRYSRIADSGHNFHLENPKSAAEEIRKFEKDLRRPRRH